MSGSGGIETMSFSNAFFEELGRSPGIVSVCDEAAERIAEIARATAPVKTGAYRQLIEVQHGKRAGRHASEVVAADPGAVSIEAKFGTLARATLKAKLR